MSNPRCTNGHRRRKLLARLRAMGEPCWICTLPIDYALPGGHPLSMECDELVPVSKGGSPTDFANAAPAHRCCNNWRRNRGAAFVEAVRSRVLSNGAPPDPLCFVEAAKLCEKGEGRLAPASQPKTTTSW